jgi:hypothetical protein
MNGARHIGTANRLETTEANREQFYAFETDTTTEAAQNGRDLMAGMRRKRTRFQTDAIHKRIDIVGQNNEPKRKNGQMKGNKSDVKGNDEMKNNFWIG